MKGWTFMIVTSGFFAFSALANVGDEIAQRYNKTVSNCGSASNPAFTCSGVLMRGATPGAGYHIWDPSPFAEKSGGISFSYLRADSKFFRLVRNYSSGYILHPHSRVPAGKIKPRVLCVFPFDADSYERKDHGCGENIHFPVISGACHSQGIRTPAQWYAHFNAVSGDKIRHQCGFNLDYSVRFKGNVFADSLKAERMLKGADSGQANELVLKAWSKAESARLPVQAFFYLDNGLRDAQYNQKDYYNQYKKIIPIVKITLPPTLKEQAIFQYNVGDQVVKSR